MTSLKRAALRLFQPVDIAPLVVFRVAFGALMLWEVWRYFHYDRIARYYVEPTFWFHYMGFEWVRPLPGDGMFWLFYFLGLLSILIMVGALYRVSMVVFWLCFTYVFLLDKTQYLNHFYLVSLVSFLMIFIPAHRARSMDAWVRPSLRAETAPAWTLWILRAQMGLVYFFGGIAKINPDWLAGEPMRDWMAARTDFPIIGGLFTEEWMVYLFSYGGLLLDLLIVPFLLWRRTRIPALLLAIAFHVTNARLFNIGIFPWFAIAATLIFMPPHWFRPLIGKPRRITDVPEALPPYTRNRRLIVAALTVYFAIQVLLPLRHWLYAGDPSWTEEGHTLAWHMRLRDKDGTIAFYASDPASGASWLLSVEDHLSARQFDQMKDNPDMILRFVHYLARQYPDVQIHARAMMSLNSRAPQLLIDPTVNLVYEKDDLSASDWILPLVQKPVPHEPIPALLLSRRYAGTLILVNAAQSDYPLDALTVDMGGQRFAGDLFGVKTLRAGECVMAYLVSASPQGVFVPCNQVGVPVILPDGMLDGDIHITSGDAAHLCRGEVCMVAHES